LQSGLPQFGGRGGACGLAGRARMHDPRAFRLSVMRSFGLSARAMRALNQSAEVTTIQHPSEELHNATADPSFANQSASESGRRAGWIAIEISLAAKTSWFRGSEFARVCSRAAWARSRSKGVPVIDAIRLSIPGGRVGGNGSAGIGERRKMRDNTAESRCKLDGVR
jgi:hypothetical protein